MEASLKNKISWSISDDIGYLSFVDLPQNIMNSEFFEELQELTSVVIPNSTVPAIIIYGSGRHFSSGADLDDLLRLINDEKGDEYSNTPHSNYQSFQFLNELDIPVIAAIKGVCIGSALELALHCHFRLCADDTILGLPESTFGLMPGVGGIPKLLKLAGKAKTIDLVLKGNTFNAEDALKWNIVNAIYPKKTLMDKAIELAKLASVNYRKFNKIDYLHDLNNPQTEVRGN